MCEENPRLPKKSLRQAAVDRNDMTRSARAFFTSEPDNGGSAEFGSNRLLSESALGVEIRQFVAQVFGGVRLGKYDFVFLEGLDNAIARKHRGTSDNGGWSNTVDANRRAQLDSKLANQVVKSGFAGVVGFA